MKRLNPETGKPFKYGYVREDGCIFSGYQITSRKPQKNGYFQEQWLSKDKFESRRLRSNSRASEHSAEMRLTAAGRAKSLWWSAKQRGKIDISVAWIEAKINIGFCEVSGLPFDLNKSDQFFKNPYSPSLDRIDASNSEYSESNTRVVLTCINEALNQYGLEHFLILAKAVIENQKGKNNG